VVIPIINGNDYHKLIPRIVGVQVSTDVSVEVYFNLPKGVCGDDDSGTSSEEEGGSSVGSHVGLIEIILQIWRKFRILFI
jgi:hypothetical protein